MSILFSLFFLTFIALLLTMLLSTSISKVILVLISTFINYFIFLLFLNAEFFSVGFLTIYVGAIAILLVFALMVVQNHTHLPKVNNSGWNYVPLAILIHIISAAYYNIESRFSYETIQHYLDVNEKANVNYIDLLFASQDINIYGVLMYTTFKDILIFSGVLLFIAIVAVIKLTIPEIKNDN